MNEATFITKVHKALPKNVYAWKINTAYTRGIPDTWYSGNKGDLWIEYKYVEELGKSLKPNLSVLQLDWLRARYQEGRKCAVVVGSGQRDQTQVVILTDLYWEYKMPPKSVPFHHLINFITETVSDEC